MVTAVERVHLFIYIYLRTCTVDGCGQQRGSSCTSSRQIRRHHERGEELNNAIHRQKVTYKTSCQLAIPLQTAVLFVMIALSGSQWSKTLSECRPSLCIYHAVHIQMFSSLGQWLLALVVTRWSRSTQLLNAGPGQYLVLGWVTVRGYTIHHPGLLSIVNDNASNKQINAYKFINLKNVLINAYVSPHRTVLVTSLPFHNMRLDQVRCDKLAYWSTGHPQAQ